MQTTENNTILIWISSILAAINSVQIIVAAWRKLKPEIKKLETETESEAVETSNLSLEGAKTSATILLDRINELKKDLEDEKKARKEEISRLTQQRADDAEYFGRRIKELAKESSDYRLWAAQLAKQVIEAGKIPVPFVPSTSDSDRIQAIQKEVKGK
jgi:uncharacterized protein YoxC